MSTKDSAGGTRDLVFDSVSVHYGHKRSGLTAVENVSMTVPAGSVVGLVGESGSGKSTLAKAAVGLAPISAGTITLGGTDVRELARSKHRPLQMVFQDPYSSLDPRMMIGESIVEAMPKAFRGSSSDRRAEVARLLELVNLDPDRAVMLPGQFSGGQRQRIALARALAGKPEVVIADEITSALDVSVQGSVLNLVRGLQRQLNLSMLFISHNLAVVRYVSDYIAVMYLGRIVEMGPADEILADPQHPYTKQLLAAAPSKDTPMFASAQDLGDATAAIEPPDPHYPPSGCRYHLSCPIGPLANPDRQICVTDDPTAGAEARPHRTACHFVAAMQPVR